MHRSGTSALAGSLSAAGIRFGGPLLAAGPDNERGFFELADLVALNDEALMRMGRSWADPREVPADQQRDLAPAYVDRIRDLLHRSFEPIESAESVVAVKDPRLSVLLPFWRAALEELDVEPSFLMTLRPAEEVAASLARRSGLATVTAGWMWASYLVQAERESRGLPRAFVDYHRLLTEPQQEVVRALGAVGAAGEIRSHPEAEVAVSAFISPSLRHHAEPPASDFGRATPSIAALQAIITGSSPGEGEPDFGPVSPQLADLSASLDEVALDLAAVAQSETTRQVDDLRQVLTERTEWMTVQSELVSNLQTESYAAKHRIEELSSLVDAEAERLEEQSARLVKLEEEAVRISGVLDAALSDLVTESSFLQLGQLVDEHRGWLREVAATVEDHALQVRHLDRLGRSLSATREMQISYRAKGLAKTQVRRWRGRIAAPSSMPTAGPGTPPPQLPPTSAELAARCQALSLGTSTQPDISVIIPIYGNAAITVGCLETIAQHPPTRPYEVVLMDDCSIEEHVALLSEIKGISFFRNEVNLGFLGTCNEGAARANGQFLYFLNNDTLLLDRSIDALVETFEQWPEVGVAGSKLLFADGGVQEAGGIIWRDGSAWNFGRNGSTDDPELNYARQVDFVSGASLMVRSDVFERFDGFDPAYAPAYYEDADLCMRVRQAGLGVVYQPASVVVHLEGATHGTDVEGDSGKQHQVVNQQTFYEKWAAVIASHRPNGVDPQLEKDRQATGRALIIDARMIYPDRDAGSARMANIMTVLRDGGYQVTFLPANLYPQEPYASRLQARGVEIWGRDQYHSVSSFLTDHGHQYDVVLLSRIEVAHQHLSRARSYCPGARIIFDTVDLHFLRQDREEALTGQVSGGFDPQETRRQELAAVAAADVTIVCSTTEKDLLEELVPGAAVEVLPTLQGDPVSAPDPSVRSGALFVGGFEHPPNSDGLQWFLDHVLPLVQEQAPGTRIDVVGSNMPESIRAFRGQGVVVHGFVENLDALYDKARLAIAPIRFGAGVKGKVTQSLARGVPSVATSVAIEGTGAVDGEHLLVADDAAEFAAQVVRLLTDDQLWHRLARNGRDLAETRFGLPAAQSAMARFVPGLRAD